mmetsp:Transcript_3129/g.6121  ORF Transcript_3129/g.6121 Transcript_3129/m.6121 type:complete len:454 (+) Transcript_3129:31-1392(+)
MPKKKDKKPKVSPEEEAALKLKHDLAKSVRELELELKHEEALVTEYHLQKQRLVKFWELSKQRRSQHRRELRAKHRRMLNLQEKLRFEMKVYKEKIKHLLHEQFANVVDDQIHAQKQLKIEQTQHRESNFIESQNMIMVKIARKRKEVSVQHFQNRLRLEHQKAVMALREEYEFKQNELIMHNRQTMTRLRKQYNAETEAMKEKIESLKNKFIEELLEKHKVAFENIKTYYRDVTMLNFEFIKSHKDQVGEMKLIEQQLSKDAHFFQNAHKKLSLPLRKHRKLAMTLKQDLEQYQKEKVALRESLDHVHGLEEKIKAKKWEQEVLTQKIEEIVAKEEKVKKRLARDISEVQQKEGFKNLLLEKKIETMNADIDTTNAALKEIMNSTQLPPEVIGNLKFTVEDVVAERTKEIEKEQDKRVQLRKAYYDTIKTYETLLKKYNIPLEELGFVPAAV